MISLKEESEEKTTTGIFKHISQIKGDIEEDSQRMILMLWFWFPHPPEGDSGHNSLHEYAFKKTKDSLKDMVDLSVRDWLMTLTLE